MRYLKNAAIATGVVTVLLVGFLVFSVGTTFRHWPWTLTTVYDEGSAFGLRVGDSRADTLAAIIGLQTAGSAEVLSLLEVGMTANETYSGYPARMDDLSRVSQHPTWHLGLSDCNCWLLLRFNGDRLVVITHKRYRGPTE